MNIAPARTGPTVTDETNYLNDLTIARGMILTGSTPAIQDQCIKKLITDE